MATATRFEDLSVWQKSRELVHTTYRASSAWRDRSLQDQIRRAAVSVLSNIAEGFERGTREEFVHFLYIAKGSCGEVRAQLYVAADMRYVSEEERAGMAEQARIISAMLYRLIESLKVSKYKGLKFKQQKDPKLEAFEEELRRLAGQSRKPPAQ